MCPFVQLHHTLDGAVEEVAVVRHDDDGSSETQHEFLQAIESGEVEVVGRLVEQKDVEPGQQHRGELRARSLAA